MTRSLRALGTALAGTVLTLVLGAAAMAADEPVAVGAAMQHGQARLSFDWRRPASYEAVLAGNLLTVRFARPFLASLDALPRLLPDYVERAGYGADRSTIVVTLKKPVEVESAAVGNRVTIDLRDAAAPRQASATAPEAAPQVKPPVPADPPPVQGEPIRLWAGNRAGGGKRLVLGSDAPFDLDLAEQGRAVTITLPRPLAPVKDLTAIAGLAPRVADTTIALTLPEGSALKRSGQGRRIALDLVRAPGAAASESRPAAAVPAVASTSREPEAAGDKQAPIVLSLGRGREGGNRLILASHTPFDLALAQTGREATLTLSRPLGRFKTPAAIARLNPRISGATLALTLPEGRIFERSGRDRRIVLDLVKGAPAAPAIAAAAPATIPPAAPPAAIAPPMPSVPQTVKAVPSVPQTVKAVPLVEGGSLRFAPAPTAAAVFRRGHYLWVAFDGVASVDLAGLAAGSTGFVAAAEDLHASAGTVLRFRIADGLEPALRRSDSEWIVDLLPHPARPETPLQSQVETPPPRLDFAVVDAAPPISIADPAVGDELVIVPLRDPGQGVERRQSLIDLDILPSVQGLVFAPRSDGIKIAALADRVEVTSGDGLLVSTDTESSRFRARRDRVFDFAAWAGTGDPLARRRALEQAIIAAKPDGRTWPRINLARFFAAIGYGPEACGVIAAIERDDPSAMLDPSLRALRGVARLIAGDTDAAAADLATPLIDGDPDLDLWRGALLADRGDFKDAVPAFDHGMSVLPTYPPLLRNRLALQAADARTTTGLGDGGLIAAVLADNPTPAEALAARFLQGRLLANKGDVDGAVRVWDEVAAGNDRLSRARALVAKTELLFAAHRIDRPRAIEALDQLRFAWRGGDIEFNLLRRIGELKIADGDYRGGLGSLREALLAMPQNPQAAATKTELASAFAGLFLGPEATGIPPLQALAVYEENRDLMPDGDKGDAITRKLADRLAAVDLLDRAAELLDAQAKTRLSGVEKAKVMTRVALLRLLDRNPDAALAALDVAVDGTLPPALTTQRQELRSRVLLELQKPADALAALAGDTAPAADTLRGEIAVKTQDWPAAAAVFARLTGDQPPEDPLSPDRARDVLNWAVALTLAKDHDGIAALREKYAAAMAKTPLADGFRIVAGADTAGATDMRELTSRLAQVSDLQDFMKNYRQMVEKESLSAVN